MRDTSIALIEFHWLSPAPVRMRKVAAPRRRVPPPPTTGGYQLPGGSWRAFASEEIYCGSPIVFLHVIPDEEAPAPSAVWHRIH
ncbi:hypothetical protein RKE25_00015 [Dyella sp. BiH032]|uniref:hypothetical protein n=1 Tax=Dyella sp. BiH032 TaxID=3075430 RepID=UPI0028934467|nr:hypothetical protein [Dyella sp. BiH032]WNL46061.1 hypothetical protein RKE25_00015 [Dyella sp. BiH032]